MPIVDPDVGSGGAGQISIYENSIDKMVSGKASKIIFATKDKYGFTAVQDSLDASGQTVIIGDAPVFVESPFNGFSWNNPEGVPPAKATAPFHVEFDPIADYNNSIAKCSNDGIFQISKNSPVGGFGPNSKMKTIVTRYEDGLALEAEVTVEQNINETTGLRVSLSGYASDGDGSQFAATSCVVQVDINALFGGVAIEGSYKIEFEFTNNKGKVSTFSYKHCFYDTNQTRPVISGSLSVLPVTSNPEGIKYLSGIGYFTGQSNWQIDIDDIEGILSNCGKVDNALMLDMSPVNCKLAGLHFNKPYYNFDTPYSFDSIGRIATDTDALNPLTNMYYINPVSYRHVGLANFKVTPSDPFGSGASKLISPAPRICYDNTATPESTNLAEYFESETYRLKGDYTTAWDSEAILVDGNALVGLGKLLCPQDMFRVDNNTPQALGTAANLTAYIPNRKVTGEVRNQPNYSGFNRDGVYFRKFTAANPTLEYAKMSINISANSDVKTLMDSGKLRVYIWKLNSTDQTSVNKILPPAYVETQPALSRVNSIWAHAIYDFNNFSDGSQQTPQNAGVRTSITGGVMEVTFGGYNMTQGILMRVEVSPTVTIEEIIVNFG